MSVWQSLSGVKLVLQRIGALLRLANQLAKVIYDPANDIESLMELNRVTRPAIDVAAGANCLPHFHGHNCDRPGRWRS